MGQPPYIQKVIPCECGSRDAYWHGDLLRVYCCDKCWQKHPDREDEDSRKQ